MSRPEARTLLPQTAPMSNFSFAPPNMGFGDTKKSERGSFSHITGGTDRFGQTMSSLTSIIVTNGSKVCTKHFPYRKSAL